MDQRVTWQHREEVPLTAESLRALFDNEIPAIRIKGFATTAECADFAAAFFLKPANARGGASVSRLAV